MAQILVRDIEDIVKLQLQQRAARHGRSMEAEIRDILRDAVKTEHGEPAQPLSAEIAALFRGAGLRPDESLAALPGHVLKSPFEE